MDPVLKTGQSVAARRAAAMKKGTLAQSVSARNNVERANTSAAAPIVRGDVPAIRFLGHAGLLIEYRGASLLCDPWMSESGAFLHSQHQYPPNDAIDRNALRSADFLYLSHRRFDHFDREFLATLPKERITVIIADYITDAFANEIADLGFARIVKLADWKNYALADRFDIRLVRNPSLCELDSIALIRAGDTTILNANDCHLAKSEFAKLREQEIGILFAQPSVAMEYLAAHADGEIEQLAIAARTRKESIDAFVDMANGVDAKQVICCAGLPCFLEDDRFHLNFGDNRIALDEKDVLAEIAGKIGGRLHLVLPGDEIDTTGGVAVQRAREFDLANKKEFLREYQARRAASIHAHLASLPPLPVGGVWQFRDFVREIFASSSHVRGKIGALVKFTVTGTNGGVVYVDTRQGAFKTSLVTTARPSHEFEIDSRVARLLVEREATWEDVFLSMRFHARHDLGSHNWPLFAILRYGHDVKRICHVERVLKNGERDTVAAAARQSRTTSLRDAALTPARSL
ncbi:MAG: MBL fold metallo-hydrolase [bacterium]